MKKRFLATTIVIVVVLVLGAVFLYPRASSKGPGLGDSGNQKASIRLKWLHQAQFAGYYYAGKAGYYRDNNVDITLNAGGVDYPAIQMVASGSDTFGIASFEQIMIARSNGIPVVAVANIYRQTPLVIVSFTDKEITRPKDLIGKKVAITLDADEQLVFQSILQKAGVDRSQISEETFKYDPSLLLTGKVDAMLDYSISKPLSIEKETGKKLSRIYPADYGVNFYADTLFTTEDVIKKHPELVRKVVAATVKGHKEALANPDKAIGYTLEYDKGLSRSGQMDMLKESAKFIQPANVSLPIGFMDISVLESTQNFLLENQYMDKPLSLSGVYTNEFVPYK